VIEKATGKVQRVLNGAAPVAVLDLNVNSASERGLLGIALHPNFAANKYVYLYWTESTTNVDSTALDEVATLGNRVDRYTWDGTNLVLDRNLIRLRAYQADTGQPLRANHNGGVLRFGPDGKLYLVIGDNGRRGWLQNLLAGVPVPDDGFGGPQPDDAHLTGVILRLNDDGTTPADNPFYATGAGMGGEVGANLQKIFAYGVRNSFGMAFDPQTGSLWMQENGDDAFDEINRVEAGFNSGWAQLMGPSSRVAEFKAIEMSRTGGLQQNRWPAASLADTAAEALGRLYNLPGSRYAEPEFSWRYAVALSPVGFVAGKALGPQFEGDLFVGEGRTTLYNGYLFRLKLSADRRSISFADARLADKVADNKDKFDAAESESLLIGKDFGITTDIQTGPNGHLYVVSLSNNAVYEIYSNAKLFVANLNGAQEVPASNSAAMGTATLLLSQDETTAKISLRFSGLASAQTGAHIHGSTPTGANANILFPLPDGQFADQQITLTPAQVEDLKAGLFYVNVHSSTAMNGEIRGQFYAAAQPATAQFETASYGVAENGGNVQLAVVRLGDTSGPGIVGYATKDASNPAQNCVVAGGQASSRCDYAEMIGTINFAAGETRKTISVPIVDDGFVEGPEIFTVKLTPGAGVDVNSPATATITVADNDAVPLVINPVQDPAYFVRQNYLDFLGREPDGPGLEFWKNEIMGCNGNAACIDRQRVNTSGAFFLSTEFQSTGYFVYRLYKGALGRRPTYAELMPDMKQVASGIVVNNQLSAQTIESNKTAFANAFLARGEFRVMYDNLTNQQFVGRLFETTGVAATDAEKAALVAGLADGSEKRAGVLRKAADGTVTQNDGTLQFPTAYGKAFYDQEFNAAFVLMQYFGYLHRDPDQAGFDFWLAKLNAHKNFIEAEMVRSFIVSDEYRLRFGAK
ncbi:MAG TPA: PQQ-dependent sugar dehydrogenase, partial [Pyrinomonadaceae bacterium]|nr:PQQ-dependent sugar dehydrogenase [Pyrinomonadaceae bacterium]